MAETKTNIPIEIKMGNAGADDANLPAFKEGSIIFTKDTKKIYIDPVGETERIAVGGGSGITIDSELSGTSTNPVQNKVINSALSNKLDKFTQPAGVQWNGLLYGVQDDGTAQPIQKMFDLCTSAIKDTVVLRNNKGEIFCETPRNNVTDKHAVNIGYLTTKYGSTYYSSQDEEFYLPSQSNLVIPNAAVGRLFMGPEGARSTDFKLYVSDPLDGGKLIITNLKTPVNDEDAANKKYVDTQVATKQAKFAEYISTRPSGAPETINYRTLTLEDSTIFTIQNNNANASMKFYNSDSQSRIEFNSANFVVGSSSFGAVGISSVKDSTTNKVKQSIVGGENSAVYVSATGRTAQSGTTIETATEEGADAIAFNVNEKNIKLLTWSKGAITNYNAPLLGVATPVATADTSKGITADDLDYQAVNKKYVDDIKAELLNAINHPYTYDETTKELTLIL